MKKLLLGAVALLLFAASLSIVQSCQKIHAQANRPASPTGTGMVLFTKSGISGIYQILVTPANDSSGAPAVYRPDTLYQAVYYTCNSDGTNQQQIPISLPQELKTYTGGKFANNGTAIVFTAGNKEVYDSNTGIFTYAASSAAGTYICNLDGTGLKLILQNNYSLDDAN